MYVYRRTTFVNRKEFREMHLVGNYLTFEVFPQDKIIAGCSVFIAGHMTISGLIFSIFLYIFNHLLAIKAGRSGIKILGETLVHSPEIQSSPLMG